MSMETKLEKIGNYQLLTELTNKNSGFGKWGFAERGGKEYFIKQFLSPVYPDDRTEIADTIKKIRIKECREFFDRKNRLYEAIARAYNGNIIKIDDFFLSGSHFYVVTEKVNTSAMKVSDIAALPFEKKLLILKVLTNNMCQLSLQNVVHGDLKPENILVKETVNGFYTAKIIDFDSSFFANEPFEDSEDINGDMVYLAPETFECMIEEADRVDQKADVFALGVIFHQYLTGRLPEFDHTKYDYMYEAALEGEVYTVDAALPEYLKQIIKGMLRRDPRERLDIQNVLKRLNTREVEKPETKSADKPENNPENKPEGSFERKTEGEAEGKSGENSEGETSGKSEKKNEGETSGKSEEKTEEETVGKFEGKFEKMSAGSFGGWDTLDGFSTPDLSIRSYDLPKGDYSVSGPGETGESGKKPRISGSLKISGNLK